MKCVEIEPLLELTIDGEASFSQKEETKRHLENCHLCRQDFKQQQTIHKLLKTGLPVSASAILDRRVLKTFENHHADKFSARNTFVWRGFFKRFAVPFPALAVLPAIFAIGIFAAFQFGKLSASKTNLEIAKVEKFDSPTKDNSQDNTKAENSLVKYIEVPVTKFIKVPVKEKTVQVVYKNKLIKAPIRSIDSEQERPLGKTLGNNQYATSINLQGFQPVSELKPRIINQGKTQ